MRNAFAFLAAATLGFAVLAGCDDSGTASAPETPAAAPAVALDQLGPGWHDTVHEARSEWGFGPDSDAMEGLRAALKANTLPPPGSVRVAMLVNRFTATLPIPQQATPGFRTAAVLTPAPWNEHSLILWLGCAGDVAPWAAADHPPSITVEFDPQTVTAFRPLGDPAALPPMGGGRPATMMYELILRRGVEPREATRFAVLRASYPAEEQGAEQGFQRTVTAADFVSAIEDAPETVRFAAAIAGFAGLLKGDPALRDLSGDQVIELAKGAAEPDPAGARAELIDLMQKAEPLIDLPPSDTAPPALTLPVEEIKR